MGEGKYYRCDRCNKEMKDSQMKGAGDFFNVFVKDITDGRETGYRSSKLLCNECEFDHACFMVGRKLAPEK